MWPPTNKQTGEIFSHALVIHPWVQCDPSTVLQHSVAAHTANTRERGHENEGKGATGWIHAHGWQEGKEAWCGPAGFDNFYSHITRGSMHGFAT
jgi:hypothetical protein